VIAVDSSAVIAVALREPERDAFSNLISNSRCLIGTVSVMETHMVLRERVGADGIAFIDALLSRSHVELVDFNLDLLTIARHAFDRYGKGRNAAGLNFGDCMSYAVAKLRNVPLLFKGDDFRQTDIRPALS
jgi:ribonuclease VapC